MKRHVLLLFSVYGLWSMVCSPLLAHHTHKPIVTDRPDTAEASVTVGKYHLQLESSFAFSRDNEAGVVAKTYSFPTLLRFGLFERLEFRMEGEMFAVQTQTAQATERGFSDLAFGLKTHLLENEGLVPSLGFLGHVNTPTGKDPFSANAPEYIFKALGEWELPEDFSFASNLGFDVPARDPHGDKYARFLYAVSTGHPIPFLKEKLNFFIEFAGIVPIHNNKLDEHSFDTGLVLRLSPDIQLDSFISVGLTGATTDFVTGLGFSWRI